VRGVTGLTADDIDFVVEAAIVPAPDGTYTFENSAPFDGLVTGSDAADGLTAPAGNPLMLAGAGNDTVTAGAGTTDGLIVLGDGDDSYVASGARADLSTGAGNDRVDYTTGPDTAPQSHDVVRFDTGAGDDQVIIRAPQGPLAAGSLPAVGLDIALGAGNDVLTLEKDVLHPVTVHGGAGNDTVTMWMGQTVHTGPGADRVTLNVDADHLETRGAAAVFDLDADDRLVIQLETGIAGAVTFVPVVPAEGDEGWTAIQIDGETMVRLAGTLTADDPRITITRDAAFA
jgi:hypothetical protein